MSNPKTKLTPHLTSVPAFIRDLTRAARFDLNNALQAIKAKDGPFLDDACDHIRKALESLKPLAD
jgi:hypothetical protein